MVARNASSLLEASGTNAGIEQIVQVSFVGGITLSSSDSVYARLFERLICIQSIRYSR